MLVLFGLPRPCGGKGEAMRRYIMRGGVKTWGRTPDPGPSATTNDLIM